MALNLNKGNNDEKSSAPNTEKMGLNLNKSGDGSGSKPNLAKPDAKTSSDKKEINLSKSNETPNLKINLSKDQKDVSDAHKIEQSIKINPEKKKSPGLIVLVTIAVIIGGVYYLFNGTSTKTSEAAESSAPSSDSASKTISANKDALLESNAPSHVQSEETTPVANENSEINAAGSSNSSSVSDSQTQSSTSQTTALNENNSAVASTLTGTTEEKAMQVISGAFGNGYDRRKALGVDYAEIQAKVNEIYKNKFQ
jgi:hypothetical protein